MCRDKSLLWALTSVFRDSLSAEVRLCGVNLDVMSPSKPSARPNENAVTSEGEMYYRSTRGCFNMHQMTENDGYHKHFSDFKYRSGVQRHKGGTKHWWQVGHSMSRNKQIREEIKTWKCSFLWTKETAVVAPTLSGSRFLFIRCVHVNLREWCFHVSYRGLTFHSTTFTPTSSRMQTYCYGW